MTRLGRLGSAEGRTPAALAAAHAPGGRAPYALGMRAHLVQMDIVWEDRSANFAKVERLLDAARPGEGDLVVLPEMFDSGFSLNVERTADRDNATLRFLIRIAEDLGIYIIGGRTLQPCHACLAHNRATVISPVGDLLTEYSKIHPFTFGKESDFFEGGQEVSLFTWAQSAQEEAVRLPPGAALVTAAGRTASAAGGRNGEHSAIESGEGPAERGDGRALRVCPTICYDLRFPELYRLGLLRGAQMFTVMANWPESRQQHWRSLLIARAIENQAFVLGVNRTGSDPDLRYIGGSIALDPRGQIIGELGAEETTLSVDINPAELHAWRAKFPAWRDLRLIDLEGGRRGAAATHAERE
jgi:omega-amidase